MRESGRTREGTLWYLHKSRISITFPLDAAIRRASDRALALAGDAINLLSHSNDGCLSAVDAKCRVDRVAGAGILLKSRIVVFRVSNTKTDCYWPQ